MDGRVDQPRYTVEQCVLGFDGDLLGPVGLKLARAVGQLPGEHAMPGGSRFELK